MAEVKYISGITSKRYILSVQRRNERDFMQAKKMRRVLFFCHCVIFLTKNCSSRMPDTKQLWSKEERQRGSGFDAVFPLNMRGIQITTP